MNTRNRLLVRHTLPLVGIFWILILSTPHLVSAALTFPDLPPVDDGVLRPPGTTPDLGFPGDGTTTVDPTSPLAPGDASTDDTGTEVAAVPQVLVGDPIFNMLYAFVLTVFGQIFAWSGLIFDRGLNDFTLGFGGLYYDRNVGVAVEEVWRIVRDLFNLTFIFGLVYIGFKMILDSSDSRARSMLASLLGAALLVNFSLFIAKFIIDLANITAGVIARGFEFEGASSIANGFINAINFSTILNISANDMSGFSGGAGYAYVFGVMIFLAVAAFVFAAGGILLIIRFIVLNVYLVFSPVMFLGWVFPSLGGYSTKYINGFLRQAFFAPAYLLMLYLSFKVVSTYARITEVDYGGLFSTDPSVAGSAVEVIPFFILTMVFLVLSLVVAKNMGAVGAGTAINMGQRLRKSGQGLLYRNTAGRLAKGAVNAMDKSGMSNIAGGRTLRGGLMGTYKYGAGGVGLAQTRSDIESHRSEVTKNRSRMTSDTNTKKAQSEIKEGQATAEELNNLRAKRDSGVALTAAETTRLNELERTESKMRSAITGLTTEQIEAMTTKERNAVAHEFTASQVEKLEKSDKLSSTDKEGVMASRVGKIKEKIGSTAATINPKEVTKLSNGQIETLGADWILENGYLLSNSQFDKIVKDSKEFGENQKNTFIANRKAKYAEIARTGTASDIDKVFLGIENKSKEIAELPKELILNMDSLKHISESVLKELATKLEGPDKVTLRGLITQNTNIAHSTAPGYFTSAHGVRNW